MKKISVFLASAMLIVSLMAVCSEAADKTLVVFFSNAGHTENVAGMIADAIGADTFRIVPEVPYDPDKDLGQTARRDPNGRVNVENNDDSARPAIAGKVENMADYGVVFIGHPIWFGKAPKIIRTFLEQYDLAGKTVVTFCTSGSSEIGESSDQLKGSMSEGAKMIVGKSFRNSTRDDVVKWINDLGLGYQAK